MFRGAGLRLDFAASFPAALAAGAHGAALAEEIEALSNGRLLLLGLGERDDGLPRLDATVERADPGRAIPDDLASYAERRIA